MLRVESVGLKRSCPEVRYGTPSYTPSPHPRPGTMSFPPDVPAPIVFVHLAALAALLLRVAATLLRRAAVVRESRRLPDPLWLRLIHVLLGLLR